MASVLQAWDLRPWENSGLRGAGWTAVAHEHRLQHTSAGRACVHPTPMRQDGQQGQAACSRQSPTCSWCPQCQ